MHRLCNRELTKHTIENKTEYQTNPVTNHRFEYSGIYTWECCTSNIHTIQWWSWSIQISD